MCCAPLDLDFPLPTNLLLTEQISPCHPLLPPLQWRSQGLLCNGCGVKLIKGRLPMVRASLVAAPTPLRCCCAVPSAHAVYLSPEA